MNFWQAWILVLVPAAAVAGLFFVQYWVTRVPPAEPGWDFFYALASLVGGAGTMIVTMPTFAIAERLFGARAS